MRSRISLFALLFVVGSVALPLVAHAGILFFGPIIDQSWFVQDTVVQCALGWGAVMVVINNVISFLITIAIVFVAPIMIAYSGFLLVVSQGDPGKRTEARKILTNTIVGIVIALAGYMIVAAVMAVLYNPKAESESGKTKLEAWFNIIGSHGKLPCLTQEGIGTDLNQATAPGVTAGGSQIGTAPGPCDSRNTACSPSAIRDGARLLGMNLSDAQITAMSCIAMTESRGIPNIPKSETGACGTFQITTRPGNWSIEGLHKSPCSKDSSCNDPQCNLQTAMLLVGQRGYQPWTGKKPDGTHWNANAVACVQQYDSNTSLRTL